MKFKHLPHIGLRLFDGGSAPAGGSGAGAASPAQGGGGSTGEIQQNAPSAAGKGTKTGETVLYGKQPEQAKADAGERTGGQQAGSSAAGKSREGEAVTASSTLDERRKAFMGLVTGGGEYKDVFDEQVQRIIDRRFRETKNLEQQVSRNQSVIDLLMQRYGIEDGDTAKLTAAVENDSRYWSEAAEEAGMSVEQYKQLQKLRRENAALIEEGRRQQSREAADRQLRKWYGEAEEVRRAYPDFDLSAEAQDQRFLSMLRAGVPVRHAYEVIHMEEIKAGAARAAAQQTEKQVVDGIRAKGARPQENGTAAQSGFTIKDDVSKLSKKDRAEIARRAARGERIEF